MDVKFIGKDIPGHEITGDADQEAGTMTLVCSCEQWRRTVAYRDNTVPALQELADAGLDHITSVMRAKPVKLSACHPDCDWLTTRTHHDDCVT